MALRGGGSKYLIFWVSKRERTVERERREGEKKKKRKRKRRRRGREREEEEKRRGKEDQRYGFYDF